MSSLWAGLESKPQPTGRNGRGKHERKPEIPSPQTWPMPTQRPLPSDSRQSKNGLYVISSNIEIASTVERWDKKGYPWMELNIGESFWIPNKTKFRIRNHVPGRRFVTRRLTENGEVGTRVWRVE